MYSGVVYFIDSIVQWTDSVEDKVGREGIGRRRRDEESMVLSTMCC